MKKIMALIFTKTSEKGLMAIVDGRIKSLIPVFNGTRIIDYYTTPFAYEGFNTAVLAEKGMVGKNHLSCSSVSGRGSDRVRLLEDVNIGKKLVKLLSSRRNDVLLLLRADNVILTEWEKLIKYIFTLPQMNYAVMTRKRELICFFLQKSFNLELVMEERGGMEDKSNELDMIWDACSKSLFDSSQVIFWDAICYRMKTVSEYYAIHLSMLKNMHEYLKVCTLIHPGEHDEDHLSSIEQGGFLLNSWISHSCSIGGYVENSILFSNVRIGRGARVIDSIIMDNNHIGEGACVQHSIICDCEELLPKLSPNIGEGSHIGDNGRVGYNSLYPRYLRGGLTLIGRNVEVPKDYRIPGNCYVVSNTDRATFKARGRMRDGDSIV
ncbi:MAG: hypothetical protein ACUVWJ_08005 [Spirochaetota bacterium]